MTTETTQATPATQADVAQPTPPEQPPLPFDVYACMILEQAHAAVCASCPEVRSIASVLDYGGRLNDAQVRKGVWTDRSGQIPAAPDAVLGGLFQTLRLVDDMMNQTIVLAGQLRAEVARLTEESMKMVARYEQIEEALKKQNQAAGP